MLKRTLSILSAAIVLTSAMPAFAAVEIGKPAPAIEATDITGKPFKLSDHKGKIVVLEWTNHQCPFVVKHYSVGNMQKVQKEVKALGAEWVSIVSSAPGRQGHVTAEEAAKIVTDAGAEISAKILDESGAIGGAYGASTTPHMFVIDAAGNVAYAGAIDNNSSPDPKTIEGAQNYVLDAVKALAASQPVTVASSAPYGCAVKYAN
jgi:peroxiredoxin